MVLIDIKMKRGKEKSRRKSTQLKFYFLSLPLLPSFGVLGSKMSTKECRGWFQTIKKGLSGYPMSFYLIPSPLSTESPCVQRADSTMRPQVLICLGTMSSQWGKLEDFLKICFLEIRRVFFVVSFFWSLMKNVEDLKQVYVMCKYLKWSFLLIPTGPHCSLHRQGCGEHPCTL